MKPSPFVYTRPNSIEEALEVLAECGDSCKILAGGQSLVPMMNLRLIQYDHLVDINRLTMLDYVRPNGNDLLIGALTRHTTVKDSEAVMDFCPLMVEAYKHVAHKPIRNRGTLGGNLSHAYPASEMPAVVIAVDATLVVRSTQGTRNIQAEDFFVGVMETAMAEEEMLIEVRIPRRPQGQGWSFLEVSTRKGDFALVGVAVTMQVKDGVCASVRIVHCGIEDKAKRALEAELMLLNSKPDDALFRRAGIKASQVIEPESDYHADDAYRRDLMKTLTHRALTEAYERCS